jgi:hypothetical protein
MAPIEFTGYSFCIETPVPFRPWSPKRQKGRYVAPTEDKECRVYQYLHKVQNMSGICVSTEIKNMCLVSRLRKGVFR